MANDSNESPFAARVLGAALDGNLLHRVEDAGLNASAPPQQLWIDGWLVRFNPGKAQRARCINAVAVGQGGAEPGTQQTEALAANLQRCQALYREKGLPTLFRITPFTQPPGLDTLLAAHGYTAFEDTRVMVGGQPLQAQIARSQGTYSTGNLHTLPAGMEWAQLEPQAFAQAIGALRGSSPQACAAHAERLRASPVPYVAWVIRKQKSGTVLAAGQYAREAELVGLYDVGVAATHQRQGLAQRLCERLLVQAQVAGAHRAYLQVGTDNAVARRLYARMGFVDAYTYHYRAAPASP
jgi:ribosomal protein S18 acetylase RimI-like enzyme